MIGERLPSPSVALVILQREASFGSLNSKPAGHRIFTSWPRVLFLNPGWPKPGVAYLRASRRLAPAWKA